jgi:hypothetical protein
VKCCVCPEGMQRRKRRELDQHHASVAVPTENLWLSLAERYHHSSGRVISDHAWKWAVRPGNDKRAPVSHVELLFVVHRCKLSHYGPEQSLRVPVG